MTRTGVILCQLGAPKNASAGAIRRFLRQFLADQRVVDSPRWWWLPLLHGVILRKRPPRIAPLYRKIQRGDGTMPLAWHTAQLTGAVATKLAPHGVITGFAMRYGAPSLTTVVAQVRAAGAEQILLFPLFPQYSGTTTASCAAEFLHLLTGMRLTPAARTAAPYFEDDRYIASLAQSAAPILSQGGEGQHLLISFHGLPERYVSQGDPYAHQCRITAARLAQALDLPETGWQLAFQSRFGKEPWLVPATDQVLRLLPEQGVRQVAVICPGFAADCLETLEEIAHTGKQTFLDAGGKAFNYIPCLNSDDHWVEALSGIIRDELGGWMDKPAPGQAR